MCIYMIGLVSQSQTHDVICLAPSVFDGGMSKSSYGSRHGIFIKTWIIIHVSSFRTNHEHKCQAGTVVQWFEGTPDVWWTWFQYLSRSIAMQ